MKKYIILLLLLSSCELFNPTDYEVQEELKPYVDSFYQDGSNLGYQLPQDNLIIKLQKGLRESCQCYGRTTWEEGDWSANPQVRTYIDEDYFYKVDSANKAFTIYHELGHGVLKRKAHTNRTSIMNPDCHRLCKTGRTLLPELYKNKEN